MQRLIRVFFILCLGLGVPSRAGKAAETVGTPSAQRWWSEAASQSLAKAGTNAAQLTEALQGAPAAQREGLQFLVENMPQRDLENLSAAFLLENLSLAYQAFESAPWRDRVPRDVFLNDVLPYVCLNEQRDAWRKVLYEKCAPLVRDCRTPSEAAQSLNQKLFGLVKVKYSTQRKKADQSPIETMSSGLASCTGLSILLVDACRAVGVPARVVSVPMWKNERGNHTWVEIWDGDWHFAGAAEPDPSGLDRGWFTADAAQARENLPRYAIYASSFKKTGLAFPMVWAPDLTYVSAVNVTARYAPKQPAADIARTRLLVKVLDRPAGQRIVAKVTVTDTADTVGRFEGVSRGETADLNDILPFEALANHGYSIRVTTDERVVGKEIHTGANAEEIVVICLNELPARQGPASAGSGSERLSPRDETRLKKAVTDYFTAPADKQARWTFDGGLDKLLRKNEAAVRGTVWNTWRSLPLHEALKQDFDARQVRFEKHLSPYTVKTVGARPEKGWALFIAMHGGGGAPKEVNDSQWKVMGRYYRDHPETGGYVYVALRAPNDSWNGFYDGYVYPLIANLIREFVLFNDVDPNKVFIMGYSHGGYGAFAVGPKMPDHFAAIHASAAAPTDGETTAVTLRNTVFTYMIGENDTMYGRRERCEKFNESVQKLREGRTNIYPVTMQFIAGNGHTGLPDRDKIASMYPAVRNPVPRNLSWLMTDSVITDFFWLQARNPAKNLRIDAACHDNRLTLTTSTNMTATVLLDSRLIDLKRPVVAEIDGRKTTMRLKPSLLTLCRTMSLRGDPDLAFSTAIELPLPARRAIQKRSSRERQFALTSSPPRPSGCP